MKYPAIVEIPEKKFAGMRISLSFAKDRTSELWRGFRPVVSSIVGRTGGEMFSVKVYHESHSFEAKLVFRVEATLMRTGVSALRSMMRLSGC